MSSRPGFARLRESLLAVCALVFGACNGADRLTNATDDLPDAAVAPPPPAASPVSFANVTTSGIPFGFFHMPTSEYGATYTGALRGISATALLSELETARKAGARVMISLVGADKTYKNADGTFSLEKWKGRLTPFKGINLAPYVTDGTIIGHYLIDEPNDPSNWANTLVSRATLDEMAGYSKQIWPTMPTIVRASPTYLKGYAYQYLDAGWAQYHSRFGDVSAWLAKSVADAKLAGLALVTGVNTIGGGNATVGLPGYYMDTYALTAGQLQAAGATILAEPYGCAFLSWRYNQPYQSRADVKAVLANLSTLAQSHPARTCKGGAQATPPPTNKPPTAAFTAPSCTPNVPCQFTDGSSDTDGTIASWSWIFGDGKASSAKNPANTYTAAGPFTVTLTVTDDKGAPKSISQTVTVGSTPPANQAPVAAFTAPSCTMGVACAFTDGSTDADGTIASRTWTFGNGTTSTVANPSVTYATATTFTVTLAVTDDKGAPSSITKSVIVAPVSPTNQAPVAAFTAPSCTVGVACAFTDGSTDADGAIASRTWTFGNGTTSTAANPSVTYATATTFTVTLAVTDDKGAPNSISKSVIVGPAGPPANQAPTAAFTSPSCAAAAPCKFTDVSTDADGTIAGRSWTFGNGTTSTEADPSIAYAAAGPFTVSLTVTDDKGMPGSVSKTVTITPAPLSPLKVAFTAASCTAAVPCQFTDGSTDTGGIITKWSWSWGNGKTSSVRHPTPIFATAGPYTVTLTVTDDKARVTSLSKSVTVAPALPTNQAPVAAFTAPSCTVGVACAFTDGSTDADGSIASRSWTFGDGTTSTAANPSVTYATATTYSVVLAVTDDKGAPNSVTKSVVVAPALPTNHAPVAAFTAPSCTVGVACAFTDGSTDADGSIASRTWTFGNGTTSTVANPSVTYATATTYSVILAVTDDKGAPNSITKSVVVAPAAPTNQAPVAAFTAPSCTAAAPCKFTDGSTDADGTIASRTWTFGNGTTSTEASPSIAYAAAGPFTVSLTVTDDKGMPGSVSKTVTIAAAPVTPLKAAFTTASCTAGTLCQFTDGSTDTDAIISAWTWDFGNGKTSAVRHPKPTYAAGGLFTVTLTVTDTKGRITSVSKSITVAGVVPVNQAPVAAFTAPSCTVGVACAFSDGSTDADGSIASRSWAFGNGASSTQANPTVTYATANTYTVTLAVTDDKGAPASVSKSVIVAPVSLPGVTPIVLSLKGWVKAPFQYATLTWTGGAGSTLDVYRNGVLLTNTPNDQRYTNARNTQKPGTYTYKLCETGAASQCSNSATVTFP